MQDLIYKLSKENPLWSPERFRDTLVSQTKRPQILGPNKLISVPVLGGLHHRYVRVAA